MIMSLVYLKKLIKILMIFLWSYSTSQGKSSSAPAIWSVPPENSNFFGREDILNKIENIFQSASSKTAVLTGASGFGKSQIAKKYIYNNYSNYDVIWWFKGNQYMIPQFEIFSQVIALELGLNLRDTLNFIGSEKLVMLTKDAIRKKGLKCLIIFDDIQVYADIEPYIPFTHENNVHSIITTKNANLSASSIRINAFSDQESLGYIDRFLPDETKDTKLNLSHHFAGCPISIALAIDYIKNHPEMSIKGYLKKHDIEASSSPQLIFEAEEKLGSSTDGYKMDLFNAIKLNLKDLKSKSFLAFQLIGFLSILHHDSLGSEMINEWLKSSKTDKDMMELVNTMNKYSLIDKGSTSKSGKVNLRMHELIQKIVNTLIPIEEKKKHIDTAIEILIPLFNDRSDVVVEKILKDNTSFLHAFKLAEEADKINYHTSELSSLRVKILDVLVGIIRDFPKVEAIKNHLDRDFERGIKLLKADEVLYNTNLFLFSFIYAPAFDKAIIFGKKALSLLETEEGMIEEKLRLYSNLIQYFSLTGLIDEAEKFAIEGEKYFSVSLSTAYNALYVLATSVFLNEKGDFDKSIELIKKNQELLEKQEIYPSMYSFTLNQLCEALIKKGEINDAKEALILTEKMGREFYSHENNNFFAKLFALKALVDFSKKENFDSSKELLEKSLDIYNTIYCGERKHKNQGSVHLYLAKLYFINQQYEEAKNHCLKSEEIYEKVLKENKIYDVSELYKLFAMLGVELIDESLTHVYFKKHINTFDIDHFNTQEMVTYLDERGLNIS